MFHPSSVSFRCKVEMVTKLKCGITYSSMRITSWNSFLPPIIHSNLLGGAKLTKSPIPQRKKITTNMKTNKMECLPCYPLSMMVIITTWILRRNKNIMYLQLRWKGKAANKLSFMAYSEERYLHYGITIRSNYTTTVQRRYACFLSTHMLWYTVAIWTTIMVQT